MSTGYVFLGFDYNELLFHTQEQTTEIFHSLI